MMRIAGYDFQLYFVRLRRGIFVSFFIFIFFVIEVAGQQLNYRYRTDGKVESVLAEDAIAQLTPKYTVDRFIVGNKVMLYSKHEDWVAEFLFDSLRLTFQKDSFICCYQDSLCFVEPYDRNTLRSGWMSIGRIRPGFTLYERYYSGFLDEISLADPDSLFRMRIELDGTQGKTIKSVSIHNFTDSAHIHYVLNYLKQKVKVIDVGKKENGDSVWKSVFMKFNARSGKLEQIKLHRSLFSPDFTRLYLDDVKYLKRGRIVGKRVRVKS